MFGNRFKDLFHPETGLHLPQEYCGWLLPLCVFMAHYLFTAFTYAFISTCQSFITVGAVVSWNFTDEGCLYDLPDLKSPVFNLFPTKSRSFNFSRRTEPLEVKFFVERPLQCVQTIKAHCITRREALCLSQGPSLLTSFQIVSCRSCPFAENEKAIVDIKRSKMAVPLRTRLVLSILMQIGALETLHCGSNVPLLWTVKQPWIHWVVSTP